MIKAGFKKFEFTPYPEKEQSERSELFLEMMDKRRSLREFSDRDVPNELIETIVKTASTAPSGANKQPWTFCIVKSAEIKSKIREAAEAEEYENYHGRMNEEWLADLKKFDTDWNKPFLEIAPALIVVFKQSYEELSDGKSKNYYVNESVGIATGILLAAIQNAGLVSLTHTPSPLNFLANILQRPKNEKAFLLIPIGYPSDNAVVPILKRKESKEFLYYY